MFYTKISCTYFHSPKLSGSVRYSVQQCPLYVIYLARIYRTIVYWIFLFVISWLNLYWVCYTSRKNSFKRKHSARCEIYFCSVAYTGIVYIDTNTLPRRSCTGIDGKKWSVTNPQIRSAARTPLLPQTTVNRNKMWRCLPCKCMNAQRYW